jgi:hypothetical protein
MEKLLAPVPTEIEDFGLDPRVKPGSHSDWLRLRRIGT